MIENFKRKILKNGMTVLFEKRNVPVVSVILAVKSGSNNESLCEKGISHYIEHMLYKGTKNRTAKKIAEDIEKNGGELNGFTSEEITGYWCKLPSNKLDFALNVLSDIIKNPLFDPKELEKEKKVIFEEMNIYRDNPHFYVFNEIQKCLYGGVMGVDIIGTRETMASITREKIIKRFNQFYTSNNLILCVVGDADFNEIIKFAEKNFNNSKFKTPKPKIILKRTMKTEKRKGIDQANLIFGYHSTLQRDNKVYAARILISLLAEGMSSRLFEQIREKRNLAYSIKGSLEAHRDFSYSWIYVGTMKENIGKVKKIILEEFRNISKTLTEKELYSIKTKLLGQFKISMEDSQVQMVNLIGSEILNKAEDFYKFEEKISKVKLKDVKKLALEVFNGNHSFFALVPDN